MKVREPTIIWRDDNRLKRAVRKAHSNLHEFTEIVVQKFKVQVTSGENVLALVSNYYM